MYNICIILYYSVRVQLYPFSDDTNNTNCFADFGRREFRT